MFTGDLIYGVIDVCFDNCLNNQNSHRSFELTADQVWLF